MRYFDLFASVACLLVAAARGYAENSVEAGAVKWGRDLDAALKQCGETKRPVFVLFQEIPGCGGCQKFGRTVLSNPLLMEAIEDEFIPVLVYNNRGGSPDAQLCKRFGEPAWNYQVVRFLDAQSKDLIPRKDKVWTTGALATRMIAALNATKRTVPNYLQLVANESAVDTHGVSAFAMSCFWTGERKLGAADGVISTEAGWMQGREVTRVVYDKTQVTLQELTAQAATLQCAQKVYVARSELTSLEGVPVGALDKTYRRAKDSDQKKQLTRWPEVLRVPGVTPAQLTKINAFAPVDREKAMEWLSPRQRASLKQQTTP